MSYKRKQRGAEKDQVVFPVAENLSEMPTTYPPFLLSLKEYIKKEKFKVILNANQRMILMYWHIGNTILEKQQKEGWGTKVIDRLSHDLKDAFPEESGFSPRNLKYMRKFAEAWTDVEIVQRCVAQIPWRSNITLLDKIKDPALRLWYAQETIENGFGKDMLAFQIESQLHIRQGNAITNFSETLPPIDSDLATQSLKDPYIFNFLGNIHDIKERELVNDVLCSDDDNKTLGLLLVKQKDKVVAEYTLSGIKNPIGISNWENEIIKSLPENFKNSLPSIQEIEKEFENDDAL